MVKYIIVMNTFQHPQSNVSILLCGDFNSVPECGIYQLMTENYIPENYKDWSSSKDFFLYLCYSYLIH